MTESRLLGRDEREAKGGGVAQHSHARSNIVALLRARPPASSPPPALEAEFWAVPTRSPAGWRKEAPYDVGARRQTRCGA